MKNRVNYIDNLRILATIAVVTLHTSANHWANIDVQSDTWAALNFYNSIVRWAVPVFVMISGACFLQRDISIKRIYTKNIFKIVTAFVFWSALYALIYNSNSGLKTLFLSFASGHYHLWFCFLITGLYMLLPIIKLIADNPKITKYYLILSFVFTFVLPQIATLLGELGSHSANSIASEIRTNLGYMSLGMLNVYVFYFLLGHYINQKELLKRQTLIYALGILGFIFTIATSLIISRNANQALFTYYELNTVNVLLEAVAVFTFAKYHLNVGTNITKLAPYSFGAYLIHALILDKLEIYFNISAIRSNAWIATIGTVFITACLSFLASAALNRISIIKKYFV